jgi:hypothetical protein
MLIACGGGGGDIGGGGAGAGNVQPAALPAIPGNGVGVVNDAEQAGPELRNDVPGQGELNPEIMARVAKAEAKKQNNVNALRNGQNGRVRGSKLGRDQIEAAAAEPLVIDDRFLFDVGNIASCKTMYFIEVTQVIDGSQFIGDIRYNSTAAGADRTSQIAWFRGFNTTNLVNGSRIKFSSTLWARGTQEYVTALGTTNKIILVEAIDLRPYLAKAAEQTKRVADKEKEIADAKEAADKAAKQARIKPPKPVTADQEAASLLRQAKQLRELDKTDGAKGFLKKIIEKYPATASAREAKRLLLEW